MPPLTKGTAESYNKAKICYICKKPSYIRALLIKTIVIILINGNCHYTDKYRHIAQGIYNLKYSIPREIPVVFHKGSN